MVLPAFGEFTGVAEIDAQPGDRVWVIADGVVTRVFFKGSDPLIPPDQGV